MTRHLARGPRSRVRLARAARTARPLARGVARRARRDDDGTCEAGGRGAVGRAVGEVDVAAQPIPVGRWRSGWTSDLRQTLRSLQRSPGHVALVVVCLGIGLAASIAIFSIVNSLLYGEQVGHPRSPLARACAPGPRAGEGRGDRQRRARRVRESPGAHGLRNSSRARAGADGPGGRGRSPHGRHPRHGRGRGGRRTRLRQLLSSPRHRAATRTIAGR